MVLKGRATRVQGAWVQLYTGAAEQAEPTNRSCGRQIGKPTRHTAEEAVVGVGKL
jgi:hypothetical protein